MNIDVKALAERVSSKGVELATEYVPQGLLAIVTLVVGLWLIRGTINFVGKLLRRRGIDATVAPFLQSLTGWALKAVLFISVASMVGIKTTSFVAILGAAGLAVGLALQGSLSNFAGGVLILIFRPFKVGDLIEAQGHLGVVKEIQIFTTSIVSPQNQLIIVPNGALANGAIKNNSAEGSLRVDLSVNIAPDADVVRAKACLLEVLRKDPRVLKSPGPLVAVEGLTDMGVTLAVRPSCSVDNYWGVYFDTLESCKRVLSASQIKGPRRDVYLHNS